LGVQVTTQMRFPLACHSRFIPASEIDDVFLYEGFKRWEVRYYLAIVVRGEEKVEVVFPVCHFSRSILMKQKLLPRRVVLEQVWRTAKEVLFSEDEEATTNEVTS
jgi:phosphatidylinositol N-acetylglucosaminyltransferase subunit H